MENFETVYIFTNKGMPGYVKIGYTTKNDVEKRAKELFTTGVPHPFDVYYAGQVSNGKQVESLMHNLFLEYREINNREFFKITPEKAKLALLIANPKDVTPKKNFCDFSKNSGSKRLKNLSFVDLDIPIGSLLHFKLDKNITCVVHDANSVMFNGCVTSLTQAARKTGLIKQKEIQGPKYWMFDNETLVERRKNIKQ